MPDCTGVLLGRFRIGSRASLRRRPACRVGWVLDLLSKAAGGRGPASIKMFVLRLHTCLMGVTHMRHEGLAPRPPCLLRRGFRWQCAQLTAVQSGRRPFLGRGARILGGYSTPCVDCSLSLHPRSF